ncbi:GTPase IMAP family member 4 isoform X2 [Poecilia reticulata]|uniref:GTPase IMAP family member 4 isoform X2 n=1 Tax=Poecilia reticulata TaxID=8081 RepID=UPI0004A25E9D|nr:PREDICTED: GTPase IMAP family member 4-like isoform X2 [Poecilia reticulata]
MADNTPKDTEAKDASGPEKKTQETEVPAAPAKDPPFLPEIRLVVLGWRWPGKSLTANTILGREEFHLERAAEFCITRETEVDGRQVVVVDTPGWFSAQDTPPSYKQELVRGASLCPPGPHAFLLIIPVGMFTEVDRARIEENVSLFGEHVWNHTIVVFTWAQVLKKITLERYIHREGKDLQWVLRKCKKRLILINNSIFGDNPQVGKLMKKVEKMVAEEGGHYSLEVKEKPLDVNQNPARPAQELGARPKQNSGLNLSKASEAEQTCN